MPFHPVALTVKLLINGISDGVACNNVLHYKYTGVTPSAATLAAFLTAWQTAFQTEWLACHSNQYFLQSLQATEISAPSGPTATLNIVGPGNGGTFSAGSNLPNNSALAVSLRTGLTGRRNRGRTFLGGLNSNMITGEFATSAFQTAITTLFTHLIALTVNAIFDLGVSSLINATTQIVTGFVLNTTADSMRRRLPGRGV